MHVLLLNNCESQRWNGNKRDWATKERQFDDLLEGGLVIFLLTRLVSFSLSLSHGLGIVIVFLICGDFLQLISHVNITVLIPSGLHSRLILVLALLAESYTHLCSIVRLVGLVSSLVPSSSHVHVLAIFVGKVFSTESVFPAATHFWTRGILLI